MKGLILFTAAIYFVIAIPNNAQAGIAGIISESKRILNGSNCDEPNSAGVKTCKEENGKTYYVWDGVKYEKYPEKANEEYMKKQKSIK